MESVLTSLKSSSQLTLNHIITSDVLPPDLTAVEVSVASDASFVETASGPAAREIKRHFDQLYGVGVSVRSPYAITAFLNQHGKQTFRVSNRELSAPAAAAQEAESRLSEAHIFPSSPPRSKRRSRLSMHHIFPPNMFSKTVPQAAPTSSVGSPTTILSRPETASSATSSSSGHRRLRKTRSFGPGDQPAYQGQFLVYDQQSNVAQPGLAAGSAGFTGRAHSQSVTSADSSRFTSLASLAAASTSQITYPPSTSLVSTPASPNPSASSGGSQVAPPGSASILSLNNIMGAAIVGDSLSQSIPQSSLLLQLGPLVQNWQTPAPSDMFAQVMRWGGGYGSSRRQSYANPSTSSFSSMATAGTTSGGYTSGGNSSSGFSGEILDPDQRDRTFLQHPFGPGVIFDSPVRRSPPSRTKRSESESSASQSSPGVSRVEKSSVLSTQSIREVVTPPAGDFGLRSSHPQIPQHLALGPVKMLREMQSFESTMTARQVDVESSTVAPTPVSPFSRSPWNQPYAGITDGYSDNTNLRRPPSAVLLRNIVATAQAEAKDAHSDYLGEQCLSEAEEVNQVDDLATSDAGVEMAADSRPSTPVAVIVSKPDDAASLPTEIATRHVPTTADDIPSLRLVPAVSGDEEQQMGSIATGSKDPEGIPSNDNAEPNLDASCDVTVQAETAQNAASNEAGSVSRYSSIPDVFDVLQTYTGLPLLDRLPALSGKRAKNLGDASGMGINNDDTTVTEDGGADDGDEDDMMIETTVIRMSLTTKEESAAPRDDPRFVIWGWVDNATKEKGGASKQMEREKKGKSWRGSWVSGTDGDQSDHVGTESSGKSPKKTRPSLGSRKGSGKGKKEDKGKGRASANEFGVASGGGDDASEIQDRESTDNVTQNTPLGRKRMLIAATIERRVAQLTSEIDYDELLDFFLTYRKYLSSTDLCRVLIGRFYWALRDDEEEGRGISKNDKLRDERIRRIVRVRTFVAIRYWMLTFWLVDFVPNRELRLLLADYLNQLNKDPLLKKHIDGLGIVKRLIKVAKECRQAHIGAMMEQGMQAPGSPSQAPRSEQAAAPSSTDNDSDVDLDFLPDDSTVPRGRYGYGYSNKHVRSSGLLPAGVMPPGFAVGPMSTLSRVIDRTSYSAGGTGTLEHGSQLHAVHQHNQGPLSRVVRTIGKLKRALNARTASTSVSSATRDSAACSPNPNNEPEVSAFEVDMSVDGASPSIRAGVDGRLPPTLPLKSGDVELAGKAKQAVAIGVPTILGSEPPLSHVLPPWTLSPVSVPISDSGAAGKDLPAIYVEATHPVQSESVLQPSVNDRPSTDPPKDDVTMTTTAPTSGDSKPAPSPTHEASVDKAATASVDESLNCPSTAEDIQAQGAENETEPVDSGVEVGTMADVEDYSDAGGDTEGESGRAESLRSASTSSFGVPLTTSRGPPPLFANTQSPWRFDIVSIDDLEMSDTSSGKGPSAPPGLRKPARKLPKKPLFWHRESVSSMGIVSHPSMASGPSSSGMSSPAGAGLGGKIAPWQLQDLLKSLRADEEEDGGVDAALKRLEGYIDPQKQEEKIKNVNEWITSIQKRMEIGDYDAETEDPRISHLTNEEEIIEFDKTAFRGSVDGSEEPSAPPDIVPRGSTRIELDSSSRRLSCTPGRPSSSTPVLQQVSPLAATGSPPAPDAKAVPEKVGPFEVPQTTTPAFPSPPLVTPTFGNHPLPRLRQSFIIAHRAELLAQHFAMIDRELFMSIKFEELVTNEWMACQEVNVLDWNQYLKDRARWKAEQRHPEKTNALAAVRARFNLMTNFVISEVILTPPSARHLVFKKFLTIAYKSYTMYNFHALTAIVTGLSNELVCKALRRQWNRIGRRDHRMFCDFQQFTSNVDGFRYMRNMIDGNVQAKLSDDPPLCIPFIGVYLSQLHRLFKLPDLIDPTAPNLAVDIDPNTGTFDPPRFPDVFSALAPLPSFIQLEPLINVHKQRQVAAVIKSLVAGQHLASRIHFDIDKRLFQKCLRLRASDVNTLQHVLAVYPD